MLSLWNIVCFVPLLLLNFCLYLSSAFMMDYRTFSCDFYGVLPLNLRILWMCIFLHLAATFSLTGHFITPFLLCHPAQLHSLPGLSVQHTARPWLTAVDCANRRVYSRQKLLDVKPPLLIQTLSLTFGTLALDSISLPDVPVVEVGATERNNAR